MGILWLHEFSAVSLCNNFFSGILMSRLEWLMKCSTIIFMLPEMYVPGLIASVQKMLVSHAFNKICLILKQCLLPYSNFITLIMRAGVKG
jgi:hypothetical protein